LDYHWVVVNPLGEDRVGIRINNSQFKRLSVAWRPGLPAGVRQADCDGRLNELADADSHSLWIACDERQQEIVSARFVHLNTERLRDALLDAEDGFGRRAASSEEESGAAMGRVLWGLWISYRDRTLREMVRRGEISSI
jgi:hypothetical protein